MKKQILIDMVGLIGASAVSYGAWLIYQPSAFIVGGVALVAWAALASKGHP